ALTVVAAGKLGAVPTRRASDLATVKVALPTLLMIAGWYTVRVSAWVAVLPTPLPAVSVTVLLPAVPAAGVPLIVAVPLPLSVKVRAEGRAPAPGAAFGKPRVVM